MSNLIECVSGRIDELNGKFKDIILSSSGMFAGIPFVPLERKDAGMKCTTIIKDIEFESGYSLDHDTFLTFFNDAAYSICKVIRLGIIAGSGYVPDMNSFQSICEENQLIVQKPHSKAKARSCINYLVSDVIDADFIVADKRKLREAGFSTPSVDNRQYVCGAEVFENAFAGDSVYAGKWARDGKDGLAIIYPKDAMTCVELLEPESEEPIVRLKVYLNLAMFGENNIFRMDGF
jgi:hypothetical protein